MTPRQDHDKRSHGREGRPRYIDAWQAGQQAGQWVYLPCTVPQAVSRISEPESWQRALGASAASSASDGGVTSNGGSAGKLGFASMTAILVGSMVGAGVFNLPARFGGETGVYGALIAWTLCQMTVAGWNAGRSNVTCMRWIFTAWVIP